MVELRIRIRLTLGWLFSALCTVVPPENPLHTPAIAISICICLHMGKHHRAAKPKGTKKRAMGTSCLCSLGPLLAWPTDGQADGRTAGHAKQTKTGSVATTNMRGLYREGFDLGLSWKLSLSLGLGLAFSVGFVLDIGCHLHVDTRSLSNQEPCYRNNSEIMFK